jgi:hypothetical protein
LQTCTLANLQTCKPANLQTCTPARLPAGALGDRPEHPQVIEKILNDQVKAAKESGRNHDHRQPASPINSASARRPGVTSGKNLLFITGFNPVAYASRPAAPDRSEVYPKIY